MFGSLIRRKPAMSLEQDDIAFESTTFSLSTAVPRPSERRDDDRLPSSLCRRIPEVIAEQGFMSLAITMEHSQRAGWLPGPHKDPFDRMLAAQAQALDIPIASNDRIFESFGVIVIW